MVLLNLLACSAGGFITMCRMTKMSSSSTRLVVRWQYVAFFCAFFYSGWSFLLTGPADPSQLMMSIVVAGWLLAGTDEWVSGLPRHARREHRA